MTVILNEAAIAKLFEAPQGPVARFVERVAERVQEDIAEDIAGYFHTAVTLNVDDDVGVEMEGGQARVGVRNGAPDVPEAKVERLIRHGLLQKWMREAAERQQ